MIIRITTGTGESKTRKSAFDHALCDAGISNYNLIKLSSVIPKGCEIVEGKAEGREDEHGHRLYVVMAECYQAHPGRKAVAGLGWVRANRNKGRGIFVESAGSSREEVSASIRRSIESMRSYRPEEHGEIMMKLAERECKADVACAVVAAVYKSEGWE
jgi:arginine decarboxylase